MKSTLLLCFLIFILFSSSVSFCCMSISITHDEDEPQNEEKMEWNGIDMTK